MTAVWLLPVIPVIVCAGSGGQLAREASLGAADAIIDMRRVKRLPIETVEAAHAFGMHAAHHTCLPTFNQAAACCGPWASHAACSWPRLLTAISMYFCSPFSPTVFSYLLWGVGVPLSFAIMTIYYRRLSMHNLPPAELVVSSFLPLGAHFFCSQRLHAAQLLALCCDAYRTACYRRGRWC